jgi:transcription-repair coupling factor (superfamily II helicase)
LAHQHDTTFTSRLADFPVRVESLSRYTTPKETKAILTGLAAGEVDIVVGTHRILSKDVRFHRLGLVVVDEEQRFGVQHKEHFKRLRAEIDLLTLTATPIPRTLHMSLSGLRDISALATPPPGRQAIKTILGYLDDDDLVVSAIQREIGRGGQVFYLHNRVSSINEVMRRLQALIPGARYAVGHGQMGSKELRAVMDSFTRGEADVLVATTIIENGVDISAAGTILIEDADRFGLAELHQLRGRVGRGDQQARCYLLVERHKPLRDIARQRLKALEEMSHLGAGFGISIKDLELRGAGNVLGAQQSGHIAAVGYDMYCRLMKMSVERMQAGEDADARPQVEDTEAGVELELGVAALLPPEWIPDPILRLDLLRSFTEISSPAEAQAAEQELRDRFGRPPAEALMLLRLAGLRAELEAYDVRRIALRDEVYLVEYGDPVAFEGLFAAKQAEVRRIRAGLVHVVLPKGKEEPLEALKWLEGLAGVEPVEPSPVH